MATTSIEYKHPYATIYWRHQPVNGGWQDASLLSGYVGGQGEHILEIASATAGETGYLQCVLTTPDGEEVYSDEASLTGDELVVRFVDHPQDLTLTASLSFVDQPEDLTIDATP